jgi:hypothetical protein
MVGGSASRRAGQNAQPSLMYVCSGAGNGTRTRDPLLGKNAGRRMVIPSSGIISDSVMSLS